MSIGTPPRSLLRSTKARALALAGLLLLAAAAASAEPAPAQAGRTPAGGSADPPPITLSIGSEGGVLWGMATELVYVGTYKLSELDYPIQPIVYAGGRIEAKAFGGLEASVRFSAGIPTWTGNMTDSDFLNGDGVRTNFSQSASYLERAIFLDARVGWRLPASPRFALEPFLAYKYIDVKWSAHNGYLQYPPQSAPPYTPWSSSEPKTYLYGTVLTYNQVFIIPAAGLKIIVRPWDRVTITGAIAVSPFAFLNDTDEHPLRYLIFFDSMSNGLYVEPELSLSWRATGNLELFLRLSYQSISEPNNGQVVVLDTNPSDSGYGTPTALSGETSGATFAAFGAEAGASIRF